VSGAAGSAISNVVTYPLSLLITRLQVQRQLRKLRATPSASPDEYKDIADAARKIYAQEGGLSAFYSGCLQDSAKTVCDAFLFFLVYNFVKQGRLNKHGTKRLPVHEEIAVAMLAGAFSRFFTAPVQNIVTRKQTAAMVAAQSDKRVKPPTTADIALQIRQEKGILGFWSGYSATLILTFNPALTFVLHESLLRLLVKRENRASPGPKKTFIIAALSKAVASAITYPFSLAKSRAQVSSRAPVVDVEKISTSDTKEPMAQKATGNMKQQTIFSTIIQIAQEEGISSLYQGLEGEVLKGFFSHGLTMLLKERIHRIVVHTYYLVLKLSKQYPSPDELAKSAAQTIAEKASDVTTKAQQAVQNFTDKSEEILDRTMGTVTDLYHHGKENQMQIWDEYLMTDDDED
jgi:hypothetical protein